MEIFQKSGVTLVESTKIENHYFHIKLLCQKPMLRQIEWGAQNGPTTKNGNLPLTTLFFSKFCFSLKSSYEGLIWCTNYPNIHIHTFSKRWSFIWRRFQLLVSLTWNLQYIISIWRERYWQSFKSAYGYL